MLKNRSLVFKQSFWVIASLVLIAGSIFFVMRKQALRSLTEAVEAQAVQIGEATVARLDRTFFESARIAEMLALRLENEALSEVQLDAIMVQTLQFAHRQRPEILAVAVAFEPEAGRERMRLAELAGGKVRMLDGHDYSRKSWYVDTRNAAAGNWCEPFVGDFIREPLAIYSVPFYRTTAEGKREFAGVVCVDLSLAWLNELIGTMKIADSGYAFVISKSGRFVSHPQRNWAFHETIFSIADRDGDENFSAIGQAMVKEARGFARYEHPTRERLRSRIYHLPLTSTHWALGVVFPERELFALVTELSETFFTLGTFGLALVLLVVIWISMRLVRPLKALAAAAREIGEGNFTVALPPPGGNDELGALTRSFAQMRDALVRHIENLKTVTAAKQRIESELKVAQAIQRGILPEILPPFSCCEFFEIDAFLNPAREVGGDLYDFFAPEPRKIAMIIGDVSGKGVPASLFMAVTQTLHRGLAHGAGDPAALVTAMNSALCRNNEAMMFVTYVFAIFDLTTGVLNYCNAGHNPFFVIHPDGTVEKAANHGIPLGINAGPQYGNAGIQLKIGDMICFYTDGVTEAVNPDNQLYGEKRLETLLKQAGQDGMSAAAMTAAILKSVNEFAGSQEQADDITVMAFKFTAAMNS